MPSPYLRTTPFPTFFQPGEYGRAWVESLFHHQPAEYRRKTAAGTLLPEAAEIEREAQEEFRDAMTNPHPPMPEGMTPEGYLGALELQRRELIMASLRVLPPRE